MLHQTLPTMDELNRMDDLSGSALYSAEVKRVPFLPRAEQDSHIETARSGDANAQSALLLTCLNWTMTKAASIYQDREPSHSDLMDLVGHAHVKLCEALPRAVHARDPVRYLMSVAALEMRQYCTYEDPLVRRPNYKPVSDSHPVTSRLEVGTHAIAGADLRLEPPETAERLASPEYRIVYDAVQKLGERRRTVLTAAFGLFGHPEMQVADIARMLNITPKIVENELYRGKRALAMNLQSYVTERGLQAG